MPDLRSYHAKRDLARSPEPAGFGATARPLPPAAWRTMVVQEHHARRRHWDLRLEIDGVLASWAVPKGPSLDPQHRRLAVRTEDHPLAYADFEGVIPAGSYGAGAMIVWDRGRYRSADGRSPAEGLAAGKLDLEFAGEKLRGRFALVRTRAEAGRQWLLLCKEAAVEGPPIVDAAPASVLSGLTARELASGLSRDAALAALARNAGAPRTPIEVTELRPMLASRSAQPFSDPAWIFELKYDGARVLAGRRGDAVRLVARSGRDVTEVYPEVALAVAHLPLREFILDGEVAALDEGGRPSFERLQRRFTLSDPLAVERERQESPVRFFAFDLLAAAGYDLRSIPLLKRKQMLARFIPALGLVRLVEHVAGEGEALYEWACQHDIEGIVAKRADSPYETGARSAAWRKVKRPRTALLRIVGMLPGRGSRARLGALLLAGYRGADLVYAGKVGSGLREQDLDRIHEALAQRREHAPSFSGAPEPPAKGTVYVRPELACEVRFTELTAAGLLRQPVFVRLVDDTAPASCPHPRREPAPATETVPTQRRRPPTLELTRTDKIFWPAEGYTKGDLLAYYEAVWPWLAPYLRDRPLVLTRYPDGIEGKSFFQKNAPEHAPAWAQHVVIDGTDYFICNELRTLLYVVNSGAIPLHVWSARLPSLDRPDWLILDLDPKKASFENLVRIARHLHAMLAELGIPHFVKTSGQAGLHILLPLGAAIDHDDAKELAEILARVVAIELPEIATVARPIASRGDRVYIDFLQNGRGKLIAAPLSVRPRPGAPVSMPLAWSRITRRLEPARFTIRSVPRELARHGDPLRPVLGRGFDIEALLGALSRRIRDAR